NRGQASTTNAGADEHLDGGSADDRPRGERRSHGIWRRHQTRGLDMSASAHVEFAKDRANASGDRAPGGIDSERRASSQPVGLLRRFLAAPTDRFSRGMEDAGQAERRRNLIEGASGDVLEIGGGPGANLGYYGAGVESLTVPEPERLMLKRLERKARE